MELRIGGMRARRNAWAAKFFSEASLKKFSEPEAGEAARGCAGTAVDQDRKDRKEKDLSLLQSGAQRSILLGDTGGGRAAGQADAVADPTGRVA